MTTTMLTQMLFDAREEIKRLQKEMEELKMGNSALKNGTEKKESKAV